jgi:hypothetical protein
MQTLSVTLAEKASAEIKAQRGYIERLEVKAQAYDTIVAIARNLPAPSMGYGEDVAWQLDNFIKDQLLAASPFPPPPEMPKFKEGEL